MTIYIVQLDTLDDLWSTKLEIIAMPDRFRQQLDEGLGMSKEVKTFTLKEAFAEAHKALNQYERLLGERI